MNDYDTGPRPSEAIHEIGQDFADLVSEQLGITISLGTIRYAYRRGTKTPLGRIRLSVWKFGRQIVTSVEAVRRWAESAASAHTAPEPDNDQEAEQARTSPRRRQKRENVDRVERARNLLELEGF